MVKEIAIEARAGVNAWNEEAAGLYFGLRGTGCARSASTAPASSERSPSWLRLRGRRNDYNGLGDGVYFFQDAPRTAWEWAQDRFGREAAVIGAEIDLDGCMDLLDTAWQRVIGIAHRRYSTRLARTEPGIPGGGVVGGGGG